MRKLLLTAVALVTAGLIVVATAAADVPPASADGIAPVVVAGNPDCKDLTGTRAFSKVLKFSLPVNGTSGGPFNITIGPASAGGDWIGWYKLTADDLSAVIVKGGPSANVYYYPPGYNVDGSMTTPGTLQKGKWKFPNLSYMEFCYNPAPA